MTTTSATTSLVAWAWGLRADDVPDHVRRAAARHLLDGVGTALAAARTGYRDLALTAADTLGRGDDASVIGTGRRSSVAGAALANGVLVHALDFDDTTPTRSCTPRPRCCRRRSPLARPTAGRAGRC